MRIGALIGIAIGRRDYRTYGGYTGTEPDINFELYGGVGACFSGELRIAELDGCQARLAAEIGDTSDGDLRLHALARQGQALYDAIVVHAVARRLCPDDDGMIGLADTLPIVADTRADRSRLGDHNAPEHIAEAADALLADFAHWLLRQLEDEAEYLDSDEYIDAEIRANDVRFDDDGNEI